MNIHKKCTLFAKTFPTIKNGNIFNKLVHKTEQSKHKIKVQEVLKITRSVVGMSCSEDHPWILQWGGLEFSCPRPYF